MAGLDIRLEPEMFAKIKEQKPLWNGPMGVLKCPPFAEGKAVANLSANAAVPQ